MQCRHHPDREAEHFCAGCGIPLCSECAEETRTGSFYCFQCALRQSVAEGGTKIQDQRENAKRSKAAAKRKIGPFHYFVLCSSVLIFAMWGVILFGGQDPPGTTADFENQPRVLIFMVDSSLKRYAHYEGKKYPEQLADLVPKYLSLGGNESFLLKKLVYSPDPVVGYRLSFAEPQSEAMHMTLTPDGIRVAPQTGGGA